jgi:putative membrane protein
MGFLISFLITAFITGISLIIISKIPFLGVEVDSFNKAVIAGIVFGILNAIAGLICAILGFPLIVVLTLGLSLLVIFIINIVVFGVTAALVQGFRLRYGIWSAVLGAIALSIVNSILFWILGQLGIIGAAPV